MKRILLFLTLTTFVFYANAQNKMPASNSQLPKEIKSSEKVIEPEFPLILQKSYKEMGTIHSTYYLTHLVANTSDIKSSTIAILPDSCLTVYVDDKEGYTTGLIGFGANFDPYSESFSSDFDNGLLPTPPNYTYGYRLDTLTIRGGYFIGKKTGFDPANPDTLRIHVSYLEPYKKIGYRTDYYTVYYLTDEYKDTFYLAPCVNVTGYDKPKGGQIVPKVDNVVTIDYILTENDTSRTWDSAGGSWYSYVVLEIPLTYDGVTQNGFEVPYGAVLSVMPTFVPGYDYELHDTLYHGLTDPMDPDRYAEGYPVRTSNYFSLRYYYMDAETKYFSDPFGFNGGIIAYRHLLYQMYFNEDGVTRNFRDSSYSTHYGLLPDIYFTVSENTENGGDDFPDPDVVIEANDLVSKIYPNPAKDMLNIQLKNSEQASIKFINILGQEIKSSVVNDFQANIDVSDLKPGIYIIKIDQKGKTFTTKVNIH